MLLLFQCFHDIEKEDWKILRDVFSSLGDKCHQVNQIVMSSAAALILFLSKIMSCGTELLPITRRQILDSSKLKEFAADSFTFDENGSKLSKRVENIVGKGEIARYEQFLLFPQCFQKVCFPGASKGVIWWEWFKR